MVKRTHQLFAPATLGESTLLYMLTTALLRGIGIVRGVLLTWLLVQAQFGIYQLGLLVVNLLLPVLSLGLYEGIWRFVPEHESRRQLWSFAKYAAGLCMALAAAAALLVVLCGPRVGGFLIGHLAALQGGPSALAGKQHMMWVIAGCFGSLMLFHCACGLLKGRRMFRALSALELVSGILFSALAIATALVRSDSGVLLLLVYAAVNLIIGGIFATVALFRLRKELDQRESYYPLHEGSRLLRYSLGVAGGTFAWQLLLLFPAWYLQMTHGPEWFANFSAVRIIAQIGHVACATFGVVIASVVAKTWDTGQREAACLQLNSTTKASLIAVTLVCLLVAVSKGVVIRILDQTYHPFANILPLLLLFYLQAGVLSLISIRFTLTHHAQRLCLCWVVGAAVSILLGLTLIHSAGGERALLMACWASIGGTSAAILTALLLLSRGVLATDRGVCILVVLSWVLAAGQILTIIGAVVLVLITARSKLVLSADERRLLIQSLTR